MMRRPCANILKMGTKTVGSMVLMILVEALMTKKNPKIKQAMI